MHAIMQVGDLISQDHDVKYLSNYGVEGVHYIIEDGETAPTSIGTGSRNPVRDFGYGYYWAGTFSTYSPLRSRDQQIIDEYVNDPNGIYGSNNLDLWYPVVTGPVTYENGEPVEAETMTSWFEMEVDIVTGKEPIEYYDQWLRYYYTHGGSDWEEQATRLYGD